MSDKIEVYGDSISGNCYKIQLICAQLEIDHVWHEIDLMKGAARTELFLKMNPNGKTPVLKMPDGRCLPESNAILFYLANGSALLGTNALETATILSWMFFEQYSHEPFIATSRFIIKYLGNPPEKQASLEGKRAGGYRALDIMEGELEKKDFFANNRYSIADLALYAYTHIAHEGGFDLAAYPNINAWFKRVEQQPGYTPMSDGH